MDPKNIGEAWCEGNHFRIESWIDRGTGSWNVIVKDTNHMEPVVVFEQHGGRGAGGGLVVMVAPK
jgi:uncharacterized protein YaeQ